MAAGDDESGGSEEDSDEDEAQDGDEDEEMESYHTDSEDEDEDGEEEDDEEEGDSDDSETLRDGPLSAKDRQLRAQMQAMMEAAEARSGVSTAFGSKPTTSATEGKKPKSALKTAKNKSAATAAVVAGQEADEEKNFDLAPLNGFGKPLSVKVLKAAADEEEQRKLRLKEEKELEKLKAREMKKETRKRRRTEKKEVVRDIG